jgi:hypothetical protein
MRACLAPKVARRQTAADQEAGRGRRDIYHEAIHLSRTEAPTDASVIYVGQHFDFPSDQLDLRWTAIRPTQAVVQQVDFYIKRGL